MVKEKVMDNTIIDDTSDIVASLASDIAEAEGIISPDTDVDEITIDTADEFDRLEEALPINTEELDREIVQQPVLYYDAAIIAVALRSGTDFTKSVHAQIRAETSLAVRSKPEEFVGDMRLTEALINDIITTNKNVIDAYKEYLDTKELSDRAQALVEAYIQRGSMLKRVVELTTIRYYSGDSIKVDRGGK